MSKIQILAGRMAGVSSREDQDLSEDRRRGKSISSRGRIPSRIKNEACRCCPVRPHAGSSGRFLVTRGDRALGARRRRLPEVLIYPRESARTGATFCPELLVQGCPSQRISGFERLAVRTGRRTHAAEEGAGADCQGREPKTAGAGRSFDVPIHQQWSRSAVAAGCGRFPPGGRWAGVCAGTVPAASSPPAPGPPARGCPAAPRC